jgi:hypothetical protein
LEVEKEENDDDEEEEEDEEEKEEEEKEEGECAERCGNILQISTHKSNYFFQKKKKT